jgi:hypothetical protein
MILKINQSNHGMGTIRVYLNERVNNLIAYYKFFKKLKLGRI